MHCPCTRNQESRWRRHRACCWRACCAAQHRIDLERAASPWCRPHSRIVLRAAEHDCATAPGSESCGERRKRSSILRGSSSSTAWASTRGWAAARLRGGRQAVPRQRAVRALQKHDLHRRTRLSDMTAPRCPMARWMAMPSAPTSATSWPPAQAPRRRGARPPARPGVAGIREEIADRRTQLFSRCPTARMNPMEMTFAKLKALLRQKAARTVDALIERIGSMLDRFLPANRANLFQAAGYQPSK